MTEMARFLKPWFAMFGAVDRTVPTDASVKNILRYMAMSQNTAFAVAVIPRCGHTPVDTETKRRVLFENLMLNWFAENIAALPGR
jgi:pimeloyl-ACP methyl ester carboxylesterase